MTAKPSREFTQVHQQRQAVADPQTKPTDYGRVSACELLFYAAIIPITRVQLALPIMISADILTFQLLFNNDLNDFLIRN